PPAGRAPAARGPPAGRHRAGCGAGGRPGAAPATGPGPGTKLNTPAGASSAAMISASRAQQAVVVGAGTQTTALPAASAGANSSAPIVYGQFQGLITPTAPSGTRVGSTRRPARTDGGTPPASRLASPAAIVKSSASSLTSS